MKNIGKTIRDLRESKGISQTQLSNGILSKAQMSKFENGLTTVSADKLIAMLEQLHITLAEFGHILNNQNQQYEREILADITKAIINENNGQANLVRERAEQHLLKQPGLYNHLMLIMVNAMICSMNDQELNKKDIAFLSDYLFRVEEWTRYELILFGNTMSVLPLTTVNALTRELAIKTEDARELESNLTLIVNLLYNAVELDLIAEDEKSANTFLRIMKNINVGEELISERYLIAYAQALYNYRVDPSTDHESKIDRLLEVQKLINSNDFYLFYKGQADIFKKETKKP
ncbi:helix-turn-helix domain-containing protein [Lapidilactobacillus bayanensis]|uniref:helix-turn-helix domain-containing protein n=1 Tax=Lapidilactobacillus bayanensis TaxID=2485998 RepID=UPI000F781AA9|nr:Rgg/GadR/MutR family transcriptional regulator [Lapidilactobacillus bayanensis]